MSINHEKGEYRELGNEKLGQIVKSYRKNRGWTQETLSLISKLKPRTIQRVEAGEGASIHTRRALAQAFNLEDIDIFNKPYYVYKEELIKEKIQKDYVTLNVTKISNANHLRQTYEQAPLHTYVKLVDLTTEAERVFAEIQDYLSDYDLVHEELSAIEKLDFDDEVQKLLSKLENSNFVLGFVIRETECKENFPYKKGEILRLNYFVVCEKENFAKRVIIEKSTNLIKIVLAK